MRSDHPGEGPYEAWFALLGRLLWRGLLGAVVLLALYVSLGRYLLEQVSVQRLAVLDALNARLPFRIEAEAIWGDWHFFSPGLTFSGLRLHFDEPGARPLVVDEGRFRVDLWRSLLSREPLLSRLAVRGTRLEAELLESGRLQLLGLPQATGGRVAPWLANFASRVELVDLRGNELVLVLPGGERIATDMSLSFQRTRNDRSLWATLATTTGTLLTVQAEGAGDPLDLAHWQGDVFVDAQVPALQELRALLPGFELPFRAAGSGALRLWLRRSGEDFDLQFDVDGRGIELTDLEEDWRFALTGARWSGALERRPRGWRLLGEGLDLEHDGARLRLPRAQLDIEGRRLRLRARRLTVTPLTRWIADAPGTPAKLAEILVRLAPSGEVAELAWSQQDYADPALGWHLEAKLRNLSSDPWRGTPGARGVSGHLSLEPGLGSFRLEPGPLTLLLPKVYDTALPFSSARGQLSLRWDDDRLELRSDRIEVEHEAGTGRGLLGLSLPFDRADPVGPEMALSIGLEDSSTGHLETFLPRQLRPGLRSWLLAGVGDGVLERAAFVWRGSLRKGNFEHLTVQLGARVADVPLRFDADWPELEDFTGAVLVSDRAVSVGRGRPLRGAQGRWALRRIPGPGGPQPVPGPARAACRPCR